MILVHPRVSISKPAIFKARKASFSPASRFNVTPTTLHSLINLLNERRCNDLMKPAIQTEPIIGDVLNQIEKTHGCQLSRMSGSGATCFGIYHTQPEANKAVKLIKNAHPKWWVVETRMINDIGSI